MRLAVSFAAILCFSLILAEPVGAREQYSVGDWTISTASTGCTASGVFASQDDASTFMFSYVPAVGKALFSFSNSKATSLKAGEKVKLVIHFNTGTVIRSYNNVTFTANVFDNFESRLLMSEPLDKAILDDIAAAVSVGIAYEDKGVSAFDLTGSANAVAEVRKCALAVTGLNADDPFLK